MAFKKFRTNSRTTFFNSRLIADPEFLSTKGGTKLMKVRIVDGTTSEKHIDLFTTIYVNIEKRKFLAKLKKGDGIQTSGKLEYQLYKTKTGETRMAAEIRFPDFFEVLVDLRERPDPDAEEQPEPEPEDEDDEEGFFGDE